MHSAKDHARDVDNYVKVVDAAVDRLLAYDRYMRERPDTHPQLRLAAEQQKYETREMLRTQLKTIYGMVLMHGMSIGRETLLEEIRDDVVRRAKPKKKTARPKKKRSRSAR